VEAAAPPMPASAAIKTELALIELLTPLTKEEQ
jgi:hypothetical protein